MTGDGYKESSWYMTRDRWSTRAVEWVLFALARGFIAVTWLIPTRVLTGVMAPVGGLIATLVPGARRRAAENIDLVWPDLGPRRRRSVIRGAGAHFMCLMIEYTRLRRLAAHPERLNVSGADVVEAVKASPKGAVIVTAHYGNWEGIRVAAKELGLETGIVYRAFNNRYVDRYAMDLIGCCGEPVLQKGMAGSRQLVTHVMRGGTVMILVDQRNSGAPFLPFLGHPAETVTAAADLAIRAGVPLIPAVARRTSKLPAFDVTFEQPVAPGTAEEMMTGVNARIGKWVEDCPEQWFWFHRRWRRTYRSRDE